MIEYYSNEDFLYLWRIVKTQWGDTLLQFYSCKEWQFYSCKEWVHSPHGIEWVRTKDRITESESKEMMEKIDEFQSKFRYI